MSFSNHYPFTIFTSGIFRVGAFGNSPLASHTLFFTKESTGTVHGRLVVNHIYFKTVFQSASKHATFIQKTEKNSGEGAVVGGGPSRTYPPHLPRRLRRLDPGTFGVAQPLALHAVNDAVLSPTTMKPPKPQVNNNNIIRKFITRTQSSIKHESEARKNTIKIAKTQYVNKYNYVIVYPKKQGC